MVRVYGVGEKLLKAMQSFYVDSRARVQVGMDVSEWFPANVRLRQGCVMSPWLQCIYGWSGARGKRMGVWERAGSAKCQWLQV